MFTDELSHVGTPHEGSTPHSGRYEYGSGGNPYQHASNFKTQYARYKADGMSDNEIKKLMNLTENQFRAKKALERSYDIAYKWWETKKLKESGMSNTAIAKKLGVTEGNVRSILKKQEATRKDSLISTCNVLKDMVEKKNIIDVSRGTEKTNGLNQISNDKLNKALEALKDEGYFVDTIDIHQVQDYKKVTHTKVLAKPEYDYNYIREHSEEIQPFEDYDTIDNGDSWYAMRFPTSVNRKRIYVRYAEDGGADKDGTIELRRGVPDLDLVGKQYAQVRIAVDGNQYMKGMAYISDHIPEGYDIVYNSNKKRGSSDADVFKPFKTNTDGTIDKDNPFGAVLHKEVGQRDYIDPKTGEKKLSPINIVKPEGEWTTYRKDLPSQFLSKQDVSLIKAQINLAMESRKNEYEDIKKIENPAIRQKLLEDFGDNCDKAAYELRGQALPRQSTKVILPVPSLKDNEIYAPQYKDGEEVALVRFPTSGLFEIPKLKVNNRNKEGIDVVTPSSVDAVGINPTVATQLSGADFDGDTVMVLPTKGHKILNRDPYDELLKFDTKSYKAVLDKDGNATCRLMLTDSARDKHMGVISNLITDMTLYGGASDDELIRATKYSMIVVDAKKHKLDYEQAKKDLRIAELHKKYQGKSNGGARTLISRAKGELHVPEFEDYKINPNTGERTKQYTRKTRYDKKKGKYVDRTTEITKMSSVKDALDIASDKKYNKDTGKWEKIPGIMPNEKEVIYASYANGLKTLGNESRKLSLVASKEIVQNKDMAALYSKEVASIKDKLDEQATYAPRERMAQRQASYVVRAKIEDLNGGDWSEVESEDLKKIKNQALAAQRARYDSKRPNLTLTDKEWEAVNKGACNKSTVQRLMRNIDPDYLREKTMPQSKDKIPPSKISRAKNMLQRGYTLKEISEALNISMSSISDIKLGK